MTARKHDMMMQDAMHISGAILLECSIADDESWGSRFLATVRECRALRCTDTWPSRLSFSVRMGMVLGRFRWFGDDRGVFEICTFES